MTNIRFIIDSLINEFKSKGYNVTSIALQPDIYNEFHSEIHDLFNFSDYNVELYMGAKIKLSYGSDILIAVNGDHV